MYLLIDLVTVHSALSARRGIRKLCLCICMHGCSNKLVFSLRKTTYPLSDWSRQHADASSPTVGKLFSAKGTQTCSGVVVYISETFTTHAYALQTDMHI